VRADSARTFLRVHVERRSITWVVVWSASRSMTGCGMCSAVIGVVRESRRTAAELKSHSLRGGYQAACSMGADPREASGGSRRRPAQSAVGLCVHSAYINARGPPSPKGERASDLLPY
jgi:hypothetical protein